MDQAGLSKDNFLDSESTCAAARRDSQGEATSSSSSQEVNKITDYFSSRYSKFRIYFLIQINYVHLSNCSKHILVD